MAPVQATPKRIRSEYEINLIKQMREIRYRNREKQKRLRELYDLLHKPQPGKTVSLSAFLGIRQTVPISQYPEEAELAYKILKEINEIKAEHTEMKNTYDRLKTHRGVIKDNVMYEERNAYLFSQEAVETGDGIEGEVESYVDLLGSQSMEIFEGNNQIWLAQPDPPANGIVTSVDWYVALMEQTYPRVGDLNTGLEPKMIDTDFVDQGYLQFNFQDGYGFTGHFNYYA